MNNGIIMDDKAVQLMIELLEKYLYLVRWSMKLPLITDSQLIKINQLRVDTESVIDFLKEMSHDSIQ